MYLRFQSKTAGSQEIAICTFERATFSLARLLHTANA